MYVLIEWYGRVKHAFGSTNEMVLLFSHLEKFWESEWSKTSARLSMSGQLDQVVTKYEWMLNVKFYKACKAKG